jgi:hypothetical protein
MGALLGAFGEFLRVAFITGAFLEFFDLPKRKLKGVEELLDAFFAAFGETGVTGAFILSI